MFGIGTEEPQAEREEKETGRIEAFSDGVFAIAITLLILNLVPPEDATSGPDLLKTLIVDRLPNYLAFFTSFATIGVMWINHHRIFTYVRRADHNLLLFNNLLLLGVTFVPFPTAVIAKYLLNGPADTAKVAAMFYSGVDIFLAIAFNLLWRHIAYWGRLMAKNTPPEFIESITRSYRFGPWVYAVSFAVAFLSGQASFAITLLLAVFFALPRTLGAQNKGPS